MSMFKTFGHEVLLAEDLNGIMRQTIIRVADLDELNALTPVDVGMVAYCESNDVYYRRDLVGWTLWLSDSGWTDLDLQNGWSTMNERTPRFRRINNIVYMQGQAGGGSGSIGSLPAGFAPEFTQIIPIASTGPAYLQINPSGLMTPTAPGFVSLVASFVVAS